MRIFLHPLSDLHMEPGYITYVNIEFYTNKYHT